MLQRTAKAAILMTLVIWVSSTTVNADDFGTRVYGAIKLYGEVSGDPYDNTLTYNSNFGFGNYNPFDGPAFNGNSNSSITFSHATDIVGPVSATVPEANGAITSSASIGTLKSKIDGVSVEYYVNNEPNFIWSDIYTVTMYNDIITFNTAAPQRSEWVMV